MRDKHIMMKKQFLVFCFLVIAICFIWSNAASSLGCDYNSNGTSCDIGDVIKMVNCNNRDIAGNSGYDLNLNGSNCDIGDIIKVVNCNNHDISCPALSGQETWAKTFGGTGDYEAHSVRQTSDGGYIVAGFIKPYGVDDYSDYWVLKLDASGNQLWEKTFGGSDYDEAESIQQTSDGGYIVAGWINGSYGAARRSDFWVLKLDASGNQSWAKTFGGSDYDQPESIQQTSDGGYIVAGFTDSYGAGSSDFWVMKLNSSGNQVWANTFGGTENDWAKSVQQTTDGGYIVAGWTHSFGVGQTDFWILKLDASGNQSWAKTFGGTEYDAAYSVQQTSDGGYIVAGDTDSFGAGSDDYWVLKLDASGNQSWAKTFGGTEYDAAYSVQQTSDGGYIVAGYTTSYGAGSYDFWVLKLDASGNQSWAKTFGGSDYDAAYSVQQTSDGGYIVAGVTHSFGAGHKNLWVLKLNSNGACTGPGCP